MFLADPIRDAIERDEFRSGLVWGIGALGIAAGAGLVWRLVRGGRPAPVAGLCVAAAAWYALREEYGVPDGLAGGLVCLAAAGVIADLVGRPVLVGVLLSVPGALLVAGEVPNTPSWSEPLVAVTIIVGGTMAASFDARHARRGLGPALFAVAVVGTYFTVPDTEHALVLLGVAVPIALAGWPIVLARLGTGGALCAVAMLAWVAAVDGIGRPSSIVAAAACLALLVAEPLGRFARQPLAAAGTRPSVLDRLPVSWLAAIPVGVAQVALVFVASRVAGTRDDVTAAVVIAAGTLAVAALACALLAPAAPATRPIVLEFDNEAAHPVGAEAVQ